MAGVTYKISGKFDKKAITDAQSGFSKLSSVIKGFGIGVGLKAATTAMSALKKVTSGAAETFLAQNKALKNFEIAVKNANLPIQEMNHLRNELSKGNFFDDNTLNNALALATNMGLAEDQIKDVMKAATDMAASGVMPLDTAVKQLGASYAGTTGQLAKLAPELKNMTKEQLENGDAVKYMTEQYKGYAQAMSNTFSGRDTQFKNTFSDLQAAVGGIMQGLKFMSQGKFLAPLQKATAWLTDNKENILKFFVALPDLAKATIGKIWDMIKYTFSGEGMKQLFTFWGNSMLVEIKLLIPTIFDLVKMLFDDILALGDFTIGNLLRIINNMLAKVGNTLIEVVNTALQKIADNDLVKWVAKNIFKAEDFDASNVVKFRFDTKELTTFEDFKNTIADNAKNFGANFKKNLTEAIDKEKKVLDQFTGKYKEIGQELGQEIKSIMDNTELPADLKNAIETAVVDVVVEGLEDVEIVPVDASVEAATGGESDEEQKKQSSLLGNLLGSLGEIGSYVLAFIGEGWTGLLVKFVGDVVTQLQNFSAAFNATMSFVTNLLGNTIGALVPAIDEVFGNLLESFGGISMIVSSIFSLIAPVFRLLSPVLQIASNVLNILAPAISAILTALSVVGEIAAQIAQILIPFFNFLAPVIKAVSTVITVIGNSIYNILATVYNAVIGIYNFLVPKKKEKDYMSYKNLSDGVSAIWNGVDNSAIQAIMATAATATASGGSSGASYTAAKDVYVTINFDRSYVNGDAQEIAIALAREIRRAERMNLV